MQILFFLEEGRGVEPLRQFITDITVFKTDKLSQCDPLLVESVGYDPTQPFGYLDLASRSFTNSRNSPFFVVLVGLEPTRHSTDTGF